MQRTATPLTPVRFRPAPPSLASSDVVLMGEYLEKIYLIFSNSIAGPVDS